MIPRHAEQLVRRRLALYPAVALVAPRQSGKTTLARSLNGRYFDLERREDRLRLELEAPTLFAKRELVILDEIQAAPELFPELRAAIDGARKRNGRFLVLISAPATNTKSTWSSASAQRYMPSKLNSHRGLRTRTSVGSIGSAISSTRTTGTS